MSTTGEDASQVGSAVSASALSSMFQALAGLRNRAAVTLMLGCFAAAVVVAGVFGALLGGFGIFVGGLLALILYFTGINAAGVLQMDVACNRPLRGAVDALIYGLLCIPKVIGLAILLGLVALAVYIGLAVLLFICKLPWLGPVLFTGVFPLTVVVAGLTGIALFLAFALAICAIWEGASITAAISRSLAILRIRLVETTALFFVVWVLSAFVSALVFGILVLGLLPALAMAGGILGGGMGGMGGIGGMGDMGGMGAMGAILGGMAMGGGGYVLAGGIGSGILWALALALVLQVWLLGQNLVYLRVADGLDASATEDAIRGQLADVRRKAGELAQKAKDAGERARAQVEQANAQRKAAAQQPPAPPTPPATAEVQPPAAAAPPGAFCPKCGAGIDRADLFCGGCGQRLR